MKNEASSSNSREESLVVDCGRRRSSCGYCKSSGRTSISHGLWAHSLTVNDYQDLLDRGWRRSGCFLYKPEMEGTCCPSYTIRLKANDFVPSKEQRRVYRRMQSGEFPSGNQFPKAAVKMVPHAKRKLAAEGSEDLLYTSNTAFQISATLRRTRSAERDGQQSQIAEEIDLCPKSIAEKLAFSLNQLAKIYGLSCRACKGHINFYSTDKSASLDKDVQIVVLPEESGSGSHGSSAKKSSEHRLGQKRKLEIHLKRSSFDPEEYALYKQYQIKVHNDPPDRVTESSYRRFLVDTPLFYVSPPADGMVPPCGFGSFHQQYMIDGKLVAVGVVDVLPRCLSSKYLFWDPDYAFLSLGKYSALQEIGWVKENQAYCASLQYYYMGYYIHSCSKMRYKAAYYPSELLCPLRYQWVAFHLARSMLDKQKYVILSDYMIEIESDNSDDELELETSGLGSGAIDNGDLTNVLVGLRGSRLRYKLPAGGGCRAVQANGLFTWLRICYDSRCLEKFGLESMYLQVALLGVEISSVQSIYLKKRTFLNRYVHLPLAYVSDMFSWFDDRNRGRRLGQVGQSSHRGRASSQGRRLSQVGQSSHRDRGSSQGRRLSQVGQSSHRDRTSSQGRSLSQVGQSSHRDRASSQGGRLSQVGQSSHPGRASSQGQAPHSIGTQMYPITNTSIHMNVVDENGSSCPSPAVSLITPMISPASFLAKFWSNESRSNCKSSAGLPNPKRSNPRSPIIVPSSHSGVFAPRNQMRRSGGGFGEAFFRLWWCFLGSKAKSSLDSAGTLVKVLDTGPENFDTVADVVVAMAEDLAVVG
ncbi:Arginyl-tRNA--protein transferase 2 [Hibiscus syriacus]|uniref:arginyltransferase n=1 Tax=Hibiscus syriacus TaxID=106335 RepID=A0A6A3C6L9_HIBSY|nr:Arginyl-tRNA--protein transferase 2 [Hibiscus syriacus]